MSDTPETDAELFKVYEGPQFSPTVHLCVDPDFARNLERQRNELLGALEQLEADVTGCGDGSGWNKAAVALAKVKGEKP